MIARSFRPGLSAVTAGLVLLGCSLTGCNAIDGNPGTWGPSQPYAHEPMNETSVAVPVASEGETGSVARSLEKAGFFCAQVRANDSARPTATPASTSWRPGPTLEATHLLMTFVARSMAFSPSTAVGAAEGSPFIDGWSPKTRPAKDLRNSFLTS
jgi:hypothetical protein